MSQDACGESDLFSAWSEGFYHKFIWNSVTGIQKVDAWIFMICFLLKKFKKPGELSHYYPERQTVVL